MEFGLLAERELEQILGGSAEAQALVQSTQTQKRADSAPHHLAFGGCRVETSTRCGG